jgi:transcriptional regulator with XRE-family HTH domain
MIELCYRRFGKNLRNVRLACGVTQGTLGNRVGLTRTSIVNIEQGRQRILLDDIQKFARALRTDRKFLMRGLWND